MVADVWWVLNEVTVADDDVEDEVVGVDDYLVLQVVHLR